MYRVRVRVTVRVGGASRLFQPGVTNTICNPRVTNRRHPILLRYTSELDQKYLGRQKLFRSVVTGLLRAAGNMSSHIISSHLI